MVHGFFCRFRTTLLANASVDVEYQTHGSLTLQTFGHGCSAVQR